MKASARCLNCGAEIPSGFEICPECMHEAGVSPGTAAVVQCMENILNIGETGKSQRAAIESILKIKYRLEEKGTV